MSLSILMVSYRAGELLDRAIRSALPEGEVVLVDNASGDGTPARVRERWPQVRLVEARENRGFGAGMNEAARHARGDVFLLLNPDAELPRGAGQRMMEAMQRLPGAEIIGFRQVDAQGKLQLVMGPPPTLVWELGRRIVQRRLDAGDKRVATLLDRAFPVAREVPWVSGSALLIKRSAFERVGGFDERFFLYFEDIDLCLRVASSGGRVFYDPSLTLVHDRGGSAREAPALVRRAYRESQLYFWEKHRGRWTRRLVHLYLTARRLAPRHLLGGRGQS